MGVANVVTAGVLMTLASPRWANPPKTTPGAPLASPVVADIDAPTGTEALGVRWISATAPGLGEMPAAVARPAGAGPFPTVVLLHGTHGFAREYVELAQAFARGGFLAVAPSRC